jgi:hypothetical protein
MIERDKIAAILTNEEMLATPLLVLCMDQFSAEFFEWEPESFDTEVRTRFGVELPTVNRDKIWALVSVLTTDLFYHSLETFIPVCNTLNGSEADFDDYDPVTSEEAAWGIVETGLIDPPEKGQDPAARFSHEIKRYVGLTLQSEGVTTPPAFLKPYTEYDKDPEEAVGLNIGPDEHMLAMYEKRQQAERSEIESYVRGKLEDLVAQLRLLPLQTGDVSKVAEFISQAQSLLTGLPTPEPPVPATV